MLAKERLSFPKRAYRFVLHSDGNFRCFFFASRGKHANVCVAAASCCFSCVLNHTGQIKFLPKSLSLQMLDMGTLGGSGRRTNI